MLYTAQDYLPDEDTFTIEELDAEEFKKLKPDSRLILHPYHYEDAESDCESKVSHCKRTDSNVISDLKSTGELRLSAFQEPIDNCKTRNENIFTLTGYRSSKKKRPSSSDISSDLGYENHQLVNSDPTESGGFVRRIRRRVGNRKNFISDDPPKKIDWVNNVAVRRELKEIDDCFRNFTERERGKNRKLPCLGMTEIMDFDYNLSAIRK